MFPASALSTRSAPASTAACISAGSSVSMLTGTSTTCFTHSTMRLAFCGWDSPATMPTSMRSAPACNETFCCLLDCFFIHQGGVNDFREHTHGKVFANRQVPNQHAARFLEQFSTVCLSLLDFLQGFLLQAFPAANRTLAPLLRVVTLPSESRTVGRSAAYLGPLNAGMPVAFVITVVSPRTSPGTRIMLKLC